MGDESKFADEYPTVFMAHDRRSSPSHVIGILSVSSSIRNLEQMAICLLPFFVGLLKALVPSVLINIYVVDVNQVFDVKIDKVDKPDLPLASGNRWKRYVFLLLLAYILIVRAIVVQLAFYIHIQKYVCGRAIAITKPLVFVVVFMCIFSCYCISQGIWVCVNILLMAYGGAVVIEASFSFPPSKFFTIIGHTALASLLWLRARSTDITIKPPHFFLYVHLEGTPPCIQ
ncbi:hypothetical protein M0R45_012608 [Rubus argutus]|uniref:Uncharacterized protein n=1 Tax=Rubus argutus TaxID=59490 RepID=A0AAW1YG29_RUBAR